MNNTINIDEINKLSSEEQDKISNLFGLASYNVNTLLRCGFIFNYEKRLFETSITINGYVYIIKISKYVSDGCFRFHIYLEYDNNAPKLKGESSLSMYANLDRDIAPMNIDSFLYWIKNIYELNTINKESFKEFVVNEKQK